MTDYHAEAAAEERRSMLLATVVLLAAVFMCGFVVGSIVWEAWQARA